MERERTRLARSREVHFLVRDSLVGLLFALLASACAFSAVERPRVTHESQQRERSFSADTKLALDSVESTLKSMGYAVRPLTPGVLGFETDDQLVRVPEDCTCGTWNGAVITGKADSSYRVRLTPHGTSVSIQALHVCRTRFSGRNLWGQETRVETYPCASTDDRIEGTFWYRVAERIREGHENARARQTRPPAASSQADPRRTTRISSGSAFYVTRSGHALTSAHVVDTCQTILVDGRRATLVVSDPALDVALLLVQGESRSSPLSFRSDPPLRVGEEVVAIGFPLHGLLSDEINVTTGVVSALRGIGSDPRVIQVSSPVLPGNSGGPLLDAQGLVVGLVASKLNAASVFQSTGDIPQNVAFAVRGSFLREFLIQADIKSEASTMTRRNSTADIAQAARRSMVRVSCHSQ
jgi:S1-C subfamily serine protease